MQSYHGGCSCGSVRYALRSAPSWVNVCHCSACKKRTGSAFGISMVVDAGTDELTGTTKTFSRVGDSGKQVQYQFCPNCGTTVRWQVDIVPGRRIYAGGTLDNPRMLNIHAEMYTADALPFAQIGCGLATAGPPDDTFRRAAAQRALQSS